jgi:UDP-2-acetamido-3-amino-2,3-dideoxy-glucuronate N-acetyltransferase
MSQLDISSTPPRVAVVGMGYWGKNLVRNFHTLGALQTICDSEAGRESQIKTQYPGVQFTTSYDDVLKDPAIQAVVLATPAVMHCQMAVKAMEAGKDVFVEKPLSLTAVDGETLVRVARESKRILMVGHILHYHPAVIKLKEMIGSGQLGQVRYLYSNRLNIGKIRTEENILWSFAPHDISVILTLLNEMPAQVTCAGTAWLSTNVHDVTMTQFRFPSGVNAHIYVSWLNPFKEQKLVVVGSEKMAVFDDTAENKLLLYPHRVEWKNRIPTAIKAEAEIVALPEGEPLLAECRQFLYSIQTRKAALTDGEEGLRVLRILEACQTSLKLQGAPVLLGEKAEERLYTAHPSAVVDDGAIIGKGTKIWHFAHILPGARIGERCIIGQNVNVDGGAVIGNNVKIQNNVSVYSGITVEDDVFLGPSCVLTNVSNPRSQINRHSLYEKTLLKRGCTIGANSTIVCGVTIGKYAFVAAGSVVTKDVPDYGLVIGNPARQKGWMSRHGHQLLNPDAQGIMVCPESGYRYQLGKSGAMTCLDIDDDTPLPTKLAKGEKGYREWKRG